jgi:DNA-binding CsgD family transcriptional regulator/extradiol dioxygenase family protein
MPFRGRPPHPDVLTPAEWRVVEAVRHGLGNTAIARRLGVSVDAVKFHVANALDKLGLARRADLRAWDGIARDSALHQREAPMQASTSLGPIGQVARSVRDIAAARHWYGEVLGLPHLYSFGNLAFFDCGGVRLFLSEGDGADTASIVYFRVDDIHATQQWLTARGVTFHGAPHLIHRHADGTEEWMSFFKDPEDRPLALMAQVAPAPGAVPRATP